MVFTFALVQAQTVLFEGFEGRFPEANGWVVTGTNPEGVPAVVEPPANDDFANATSLRGATGTASGTTLNATRERAEPDHAGKSGGASVWFRWRAPTSGTVTFNTAGSAFDTLLAIYRGSNLEGLTSIAANDDVPGGRTSAVTFEVQSGLDYFLAVDGYNGQSGGFTLTWLYPVVNEAIQSLAVVNYTQTVIDSDPGDRASLKVSATVRSDNLGPAGHFSTYVLSYRLLDGSRQPHPIFDVGGGLNAGYTCNVTNTIFLAAYSIDSSTTGAAIRPAARLDPYQQYAVELRIFRRGDPTGAEVSDGPHTYYHFTNLVSGDAAMNVIPRLLPPAFARAYAVKTAPGKQAFLVNAGFILLRYDDFNAATPISDDVTVTFDFELHDATGNVIPLRTNRLSFVHAVPSFAPGSPITPYPLWGQDTLSLEPLHQVDSIATTYSLVVRMACANEPGQPPLTANVLETSPERLLHFNGRLYFGPIETTFSSLGNDPAPGVVGPNFIATTLAVNNSSGLVTGDASHFYGDGTSLDVHLWRNGNAEVISGSVTLISLNVPDTGVAVGVRFERGQIVLNSGGAQGPIRAILPAGFGYRLNNLATHLLEGDIQFGGLDLDQSLTPQGAPQFSPGGPIYCVQESQPLWIQTPAITWEIASGKFTFGPAGASYVRAEEFAYLNWVSNRLANPLAATKPSNEGYYASVDGTASAPISVQAAADGSARFTGDLSLAAGSFRSHFPYNVQIAWNGPGLLRIVEDLVASNSSLQQVPVVTVPYDPNCPGCQGNTSPEWPTLLPEDSALNFTRDGGLIGAGVLASVTDLKWGYFTLPFAAFAQNALGFTNASFHMPGVFLRGDQTGLGAENGPGVLLYSGVAATNLDYLEREDLPATANHTNYLKGLADYAGLNFYCGHDGSHQGRSYLGGTDSGLYDLTGRCKYYVRIGGVSGIQEAVSESFFPKPIICGYHFTLTTYSLSYLTNGNHDSRTQGSVYLPGPSDFTQAFEELRFNCVGGMECAKVPEQDPGKVLAYWKADFLTRSIRFQNTDGCRPDEAKLVLNVETSPFSLNTALYGELGFEPKGTLIPRAAGKGIDSRLRPPNYLTLRGPITVKEGQEKLERYAFMPVSEVYYNNETNTPGQAGFLNLAGTLDVSFFEDMKVHLQASASARSNDAPIFLMGGWPRSGETQADYYGWEMGQTPTGQGANFFNVPFFDDGNRGFPEKIGGHPPKELLALYRNNPDNPNYHPRAQRIWATGINMDVPLIWSSASRSFTSFRPEPTPVYVINSELRIPYLSAENAYLRFSGQAHIAALPSINLANLFFNILDKDTGLMDILAHRIGADKRNAIAAGFFSLDGFLADQWDLLLMLEFYEQYNYPIAIFYDRVKDTYNNNPDAAAFTNEVAKLARQYIQGIKEYPEVTPEDCLNYRITHLVEGTYGSNPNIASRLTLCLTKAELAITDLQWVISKEDGKRHFAANIIRDLIAAWMPSFITDYADKPINDVLDAYGPAFDQIDRTLTNLQQRLAGIRTNLWAPGGLGRELADKLAEPASQTHIDELTAQVTADILAFFGRLNYAADDWRVDYTPEEIQIIIWKSIGDHFFASPLAADLQAIVRQRLYDEDAALHEAADSLFQQITSGLRELVLQYVAMADQKLNNYLDKLQGFVAAGGLDGFARINGDSLKELRLNMNAKIKFTPVELSGAAYVRIRELDSDSHYGCANQGDKTTEVLFGMAPQKIKTANLDGTIIAEAKFAFQSGILIGLGGCFKLDGSAQFEVFKMDGLGVAFAVGLEEDYFSYAGPVQVVGIEGGGGLFVGRSCTLDPIKMWDPQVAELMGDKPFTGFYVYSEGWMPILSGSCFLRLGVGFGAGVGYFVEGSRYLGKLKGGVSGSFACAYSGRGEITLIGLKDAGDFRFHGGCKIEACLGPCPFCLCIPKSFGVLYRDGHWSVD